MDDKNIEMNGYKQRPPYDAQAWCLILFLSLFYLFLYSCTYFLDPSSGRVVEVYTCILLIFNTSTPHPLPVCPIILSHSRIITFRIISIHDVLEHKSSNLCCIFCWYW